LAQPMLDVIRQASPVASWRRHVPVTPHLIECTRFIQSHWSELATLPIHPPVSGDFTLQTDATEYTESYSLYNGHLPIADMRPPYRHAVRNVPLARIEHNELDSPLWALRETQLHDLVLQPALDNTVACAYLHAGGGPVPGLAVIAWQLTCYFVEHHIYALKPVWIPSGINVFPDALSRLPVLADTYLPAYEGAFTPLHRWLAQHQPSADWLLWPVPDLQQPPLGWPYQLATPYQLIAHGPAAFIVAPPVSWARRVLRWVVRNALRCAVLLPLWRQAPWWLLTYAACDQFTIFGACTASASPVAVFLYGFHC